MFANRLIRDVYASDDAEESMITKLKGNPKKKNFDSTYGNSYRQRGC